MSRRPGPVVEMPEVKSVVLPLSAILQVKHLLIQLTAERRQILDIESKLAAAEETRMRLEGGDGKRKADGKKLKLKKKDRAVLHRARETRVFFGEKKLKAIKGLYVLDEALTETVSRSLWQYDESFREYERAVAHVMLSSSRIVIKTLNLTQSKSPERVFAKRIVGVYDDAGMIHLQTVETGTLDADYHPAKYKAKLRPASRSIELLADTSKLVRMARSSFPEVLSGSMKDNSPLEFHPDQLSDMALRSPLAPDVSCYATKLYGDFFDSDPELRRLYSEVCQSKRHLLTEVLNRIVDFNMEDFRRKHAGASKRKETFVRVYLRAQPKRLHGAVRARAGSGSAATQEQAVRVGRAERESVSVAAQQQAARVGRVERGEMAGRVGSWEARPEMHTLRGASPSSTWRAQRSSSVGSPPVAATGLVQVGSGLIARPGMWKGAAQQGGVAMAASVAPLPSGVAAQPHGLRGDIPVSAAPGGVSGQLPMRPHSAGMRPCFSDGLFPGFETQFFKNKELPWEQELGWQRQHAVAAVQPVVVQQGAATSVAAPPSSVEPEEIVPEDASAGSSSFKVWNFTGIPAAFEVAPPVNTAAFGSPIDVQVVSPFVNFETHPLPSAPFLSDSSGSSSVVSTAVEFQSSVEADAEQVATSKDAPPDVSSTLVDEVRRTGKKIALPMPSFDAEDLGDDSDAEEEEDEFIVDETEPVPGTDTVYSVPYSPQEGDDIYGLGIGWLRGTLDKVIPEEEESESGESVLEAEPLQEWVVQRMAGLPLGDEHNAELSAGPEVEPHLSDSAADSEESEEESSEESESEDVHTCKPAGRSAQPVALVSQ